MAFECQCLVSQWPVDFGSLGTLCRWCQVPNEPAELSRWLTAHGWRCPVCEALPSEARQLVVHHDHFPDALWPLCADQASLRARIEGCATFQPTMVCSACNSLDSIAKTEMLKLPRWFSLSPAHMRRVRLPDGTIDLEQVATIWEEMRIGVIADRCKQIWLAGIAKEDIRKALASYKTASTIKAEKRRTLSAKIAALAKSDRNFAELLRLPDRDVEVAAIAVAAWWDEGSLKGLLHWYHRRHGDPMFERRPADFGRDQYKTWVLMQARGERQEAEEYRRKCRFWRERERSRTA